MKTPVTIYVYSQYDQPMVDAYVAIMNEDIPLFVGRTNEEGFVETEVEHDEDYELVIRVRKSYCKPYETLFPQILIKRVGHITASVGMMDDLPDLPEPPGVLNL